jgi:hypothetical protein
MATWPVVVAHLFCLQSLSLPLLQGMEKTDNHVVEIKIIMCDPEDNPSS